MIIQRPDLLRASYGLTCAALLACGGDVSGASSGDPASMSVGSSAADPTLPAGGSTYNVDTSVTANGGAATGGKTAAGGTDTSVGGSGGAGESVPENALPDCPLSFPYLSDAGPGFWLGADSNFSVTLSGTRALMTFQDTIAAGQSATSRENIAWVANSIAEITCEQGAYAIRYYWNNDGNGQRAVFDDPNANGDRLWIHRPWLYEGRMFLTATRVGDGQEHGMTLARVSNPLDLPTEWQIEYFTLTEQRATVGKGMIVDGDYVYLFTPRAAQAALTRIELTKLLEPNISEASLEYLANDGNWKGGLNLQDARGLPIAANTGLTIRYHEASSRFLALYITTNGWPSSTVAVSSAPSLEGPWSEPEIVYRIPEMVAGQPGYDVDNVCYGAAEHPDHNPDPDGRLLFTYTCNSRIYAKQMANLDLYVPVVVDLPNPLAP